MKNTERIALTVIVLAICIWFLLPTIRWYAFTDKEDKALAQSNSLELKLYSQEQARLAVSYLKENQDRPVSKEYSFLLDIAKEAGLDKVSSNTLCSEILGRFSEKDDYQGLSQAVESYFREHVQKLKTTSGRALQLGLDLKGGMSILLDVDTASYEAKLGRQATEAEISSAIDQDVEVLKSRIDQFGLSEPEIRRQGDDQIIIELAGTPDPDRVDTFLKGKGSLAFHLVDMLSTNRVIAYMSSHPEEAESLNLALQNGVRYSLSGIVPDDRHISGMFETDEYGMENLVGYYVIYNNAALDGSYLLSAESMKESVGNQPIVALKISEEGGKIFYDFTKDHIGSALAIVMDDHVKSVATIKDTLSTNVQISGFSDEEAKDIAVLLKTASLPIPVEISNRETVGASLGEDSVNMGMKAIVIGFILVVIFMVAVYGASGLVADFALVINLVIMVAVMGGLGSTLTLTGIAGIILSLGMAVDANVITFERIKDELKAGNSPRAAVTGGFSKAFWTIFDSNITTIIAAVVLISFGSSSVKGFASTLAIGIAGSMFTSLFLSHLIFDLCVRRKIAMGWKVYRAKGGFTLENEDLGGSV